MKHYNVEIAKKKKNSTWFVSCVAYHYWHMLSNMH